MNTARQIAAILLLVVSTIVVGAVGWNLNALLVRSRKIADRVETRIDLTLAEAGRASTSIADYAAAQTADLRSEKNRKAIDAGLAAAASAQGTFRLLNTQTVPRLNAAIDELRGGAFQLKTFVAGADRQVNGELIPATTALLADTNRRLNGEQGLLVELAAFARDARLPLQTIAPKLELLIATGQLALEEINTTIRSDDFRRIQAELARSSTGLADTLQSLAGTARAVEAKAPTLMALIEQYGRAGNQFQKALYLARIFGYLALPFIP